MVRPTVLLDCDGVLADFVKAAVDRVNAITGGLHQYHDVKTWEVFDSIKVPDSVKDEVYRQMKGPGGCESIPVLPGARDGVRRLYEVADVVIVTSPFTSSPTWVYEREAWIKQHFGAWVDYAIHTKVKERVHGDFFVDDKYSHVAEWIDFWDWRRRSRGKSCVLTKLALVHSELSEALEEVRAVKVKPGDDWKIVDCYIKEGKPEGFGIEMADAVIRVLDLAQWMGIEVSSRTLLHSSPIRFKAIPKAVARIHVQVSKATSAYEEGRSNHFCSYLSNVVTLVEELCVNPSIEVDLWKMVEVKHHYNRTREYRHGGKAC